MLYVVLIAVVGAVIVAGIGLLFSHIGSQEEQQNPRRSEEAMVRSCGDPALISLYYKAHSDEERAQIANFVRQTKGKPQPVVDTADDFDAAVGTREEDLSQLRQSRMTVDEPPVAAAAAEDAAEDAPEDAPEEEKTPFFERPKAEAHPVVAAIDADDDDDDYDDDDYDDDDDDDDDDEDDEDDD